MTLWSRGPRALRRLLGGALGGVRPPEGMELSLEADERVLASAAVAGGGHLVSTSLGLWVPAGGEQHRRIGWHLVSKAAWDGRALTVIEADVVGVQEGVMLIRDRQPQRFVLPEPGAVPHVVHARVTRSVLHSEPVAGGGLLVRRRVPGRDGVQTQLRRR